jgi:hypothetical protein
MSKSAHQSQAAFYRAQADTALGQAEDAQLDNVRERCLRSAEAWTHMAVRAERHEEGRKRTDAHKAAAHAQEPFTPTE